MKKYSIITCLLLYMLRAAAQSDPAYPSAPVAAQNITAAEYFIDTDPGFGNAIPISIAPGLNLSNITKSITTTGLSNGVHRIYLRSKDANGEWSSANWQSFVVDYDPAYPAAPLAEQNITAAEYFIDTDPGFGNAAPISTMPGLNLSDVTASINTAGLTNGVHRVYLRSKDATGKWSSTNLQSFVVAYDPVYPDAPVAAQSVTGAEYFVDTDPGFGNATPISITSGLNVSNVTANINTTGLTNGVHRVFFRSKEANGKWSITNVKDFTVDIDPAYPQAPDTPGTITYAEYFFDTDPGYGNGTIIPITPGVDLSNITFAANTNTLSDSTHVLFVRSLDDWSMTNAVTFSKGNPLPIKLLSFAAAAKDNKVLLNWQTADEEDLDKIILQHSDNGKDFTEIATITAKGIPSAYTYRDEQPFIGINYYRLKMMDENSEKTYSKIISVFVNTKDAFVIQVFPNPVKAMLHLNILGEIKSNAQITITNMEGKEIFRQPVAGAQQLIDVSTIPAGTYFIRYADAQRQQVIKVVKQ